MLVLSPVFHHDHVHLFWTTIIQVLPVNIGGGLGWFFLKIYFKGVLVNHGKFLGLMLLLLVFVAFGLFMFSGFRWF